MGRTELELEELGADAGVSAGHREEEAPRRGKRELGWARASGSREAGRRDGSLARTRGTETRERKRDTAWEIMGFDTRANARERGKQKVRDPSRGWMAGQREQREQKV